MITMITMITYRTNGGSEVSYAEMTYHIKLTVDKSQIAADGIDTAIVTASVIDYLGTLQAADNRIIVFEVEGQRIEVQALNGIAKIEVTSTFPNEINIRTLNDGIRNGEVAVYAA